MISKSVVKELKAGSEKAFQEIYLQFNRLIKQICFFYFKSNDMAEDLTIETFRKLWNNKENLDVDKNIKYYITQIAHNLCKDVIRKQNRESALYFTAEELSHITFVEIQDDSTVDIDDDNDLFKQIETLIDEESYQMLVYKYVHNLKHREIANVMEVTTSVVGNKIARALKVLKEKLNDEEERNN